MVGDRTRRGGKVFGENERYSPIRKVFGHFGMCLGAKVSEYFTNRRVVRLVEPSTNRHL